MMLKNLTKITPGKHLNLYHAEYLQSDGKTKHYEFVSRNNLDITDLAMGKSDPSGVIVFTLHPEKQHVLLLREFRPATGQTIINHPMGLIDPGETYRQAAERELKEETGLNLLRFVKIMPAAYTAPCMSDQTSIFTVAIADGKIKPSDNPAEITHPFWATREAVLDYLENPKCKFSAITQMTLFMWACSPNMF